MNELTLKELTCKTTSESGSDECRLEVYLDGSSRREPYSLRREMAAGDTWPINRSFWYNGSIELQLWDEDWLFPADWNSGNGIDLNNDDKLGTKATSGRFSGNALSFTQSGEYELTYSTAQPSVSDRVAKSIDAFKTSSAGRVWANISNRNAIATHLDHLTAPVRNNQSINQIGGDVSDQYEIDQDGTPFCGPAAILFGMIIRQPRRMVEAVRSLYETGEFLTNHWMIPASATLRGTTVPGGFPSGWEAQWMMIAAIRESQHFLEVANDFTLEGGLKSLVHAGPPWSLVYWLETVLGYSNATWYSSSSIVSGLHAQLPGHSPFDDHAPQTVSEADALDEAANAMNNDGVGIILIDSSIIPPGATESEFPYPSHYVTVLDSTVRSGGDVDFDVQTWGDIRTINRDTSSFRDHMFGSIVGF